jgi:hypothetical protein
MNPMDLTVSELMIWGLVLHLVADWPLQNAWIADNKQKLYHPAAWVHGVLHGGLLSIIFGWAAVPLAIVHMLIDTRKPLQWWSRLVRQTQPGNHYIRVREDRIPTYDMGTEVRIWTDQVFHIICIAVAALLVT